MTATNALARSEVQSNVAGREDLFARIMAAPREGVDAVMDLNSTPDEPAPETAR